MHSYDIRDPSNTALASAFLRIWEQHRDRLYGRALRWTRGQQELSEEILAQARLRAYEYFIRQPTQINKPGAWLYRITQNCFHDLYQQITRREIPLSDVDWAGETDECSARKLSPEFTGAVIGRSLGPENSIMDLELRQSVHQALQHLPPRLLGPVLLHMYEELTGPEIAEQLRINEATVRKRLQEARTRLRPLLDRYRNGQCVPLAKKKLSPLVAQPVSDERDSEPLAQGFRAFSLIRSDGVDRDVVLSLRRWAPSVKRIHRSLELYIARHPNGWKKRLEFARLQVQEGRLKRALNEYRQVLDRRPSHHIVALLEYIQMLDIVGNTDEAICVTNEAQTRLRNRVAQIRIAAEAALLAGVPEEALNLLKRIVHFDGHRRRLAQIQLFMALPTLAEATIRPLLSREQDDAEALLILCDAQLATARTHEAIESASRALLCAETCMPALSRLVVLRSAFGAPGHAARDQTRRMLKQLEALAPTAADTAYAQAVWSAELGHEERGRQALESLIERRPTLARGPRLYAHWRRRYGGSEPLSSVPAFLPANDLSGW